MTVALTDSLADTICERLMEGESLRSVCADKAMPSRATVLRWMGSDPAFEAKCAHARILQADAIFDEMQSIADDGNPTDVQRAKLRISTMQWRASKLAPKKYGERITHQGDNDADPVSLSLGVRFV